jgi:Flp pilus assembly protein TadB
MKKTLQSIYNQMGEQEKARADAERQMRDIHGESGKQDFLGALDERLAYSGVKDKFRWMTTELYLVIVILTAVILGTIVIITNGLIPGLAASILVVLAFELFLSLSINRRNKRTETIMLQFMNIVDNLSKTSDDLISILERSSLYIAEPLGSQIHSAVVEAKSTGDTNQALQELRDKVKNKHFKVLIRNLEITSLYENNYSDVIEDCRDIFHSYIKNEKEKQNIRVSGLIEIGTMIVLGIFCTLTMADIADSDNIFELLLSGGTMGTAILLYLAFALIAALYIAIFKVLRTKA